MQQLWAVTVMQTTQKKVSVYLQLDSGRFFKKKLIRTIV